MTDNIKHKHHRTEGIDIYEAQYLIYPFEQYRAIMQASAEHHIHMHSGNRVENLEEAIYILERLKEKEIERDRYSHVKTNYGELLEKGNVATDWTPAPEDVLVQADFQTSREKTDISKSFVRDIDASELLRNLKDDESIFILKDLLERDFEYLARDKKEKLWAYDTQPIKSKRIWANGRAFERLSSDDFTEVQWSDEEPTKIVDLLETYSKSEAPNDVKPKTAGQYLDDVYRYHDDLLKGLLEHNFNYLVRNTNGDLWAHTFWCDKPVEGGVSEMINNDMFPEVKWFDEEPTKISKLLASYENGGGKQ